MHRVLVILALAAVVACGASGAKSPSDASPDLDTDPMVLLPGSAFVLAKLDARAMFASASLGAPIAALTAELLPLGPEAGFDARRDVDRVVLGVYAASGADVVAVVSGRFDEVKIAAAAEGHAGNAVVRGTYGGRTTYTAGAAMYSVISARTVVAGTVDGASSSACATRRWCAPFPPGPRKRSRHRARTWPSPPTSPRNRSPQRRSPPCLFPG
jgi:hypothetical protein